jgi:hypothetical protein
MQDKAGGCSALQQCRSTTCDHSQLDRCSLLYRFQLVTFSDISNLLLPAGLGPAAADLDLTSLFNIRTSAINGTVGWDVRQAPACPP